MLRRNLTTTRSTTLIIAASLGLAAQAAANTIIYVDVAAPPDGDGSSWASAFDDLKAALAHAAKLGGSDMQIWMAAGTYRPGSPDDGPQTTFALVSGIGLYGGFAGGEHSLEQRDWQQNQTVLSGELDSTITPVPRAHSVLTAIDLEQPAVLDGLIITAAGSEYPVEVSGGGLRSVNSHMRIRNCVFIDNYTEFEGGGAAVLGGSAEFTNCLFQNNWTFYDGAAVFAENADITIMDSNFVLNSASYEAAIYIVGGTLYMDNSAVEDNATADFTAGLSLYDTTAEILGSLFAGNSACECTGGGGIGAWNSDVTVRNSVISGNSTDGLVGGNFTLIDTVVENNDYSGIASWGGGVSLTLLRSQIIDNYGAGIYVHSGDSPAVVEIHDSVITGNDDGYYGGGVYWMGTNAQLTITNSTIAGNGGYDVGGIRFSGASFTMINTLVAGNSTQYSVGGVQLGGGVHASIINSTIRDNTSYATAGGVAAPLQATVTVSNSILWNNWGDDGVGSPQLSGNAAVSFSIVDGDAPWPGEGNLNIDPLFADPDGRLSPDSPAIDAGDNGAYPTHLELTDLDGNSRIVDGSGDGVARIDIGAFEFQSNAPPTNPGDLNGDGTVGVADLLIVLGAWGPCANCDGCAADLTGDCSVGVEDLLLLLANWG